jgi:hypothetical protein
LDVTDVVMIALPESRRAKAIIAPKPFSPRSAAHLVAGASRVR